MYCKGKRLLILVSVLMPLFALLAFIASGCATIGNHAIMILWRGFLIYGVMFMSLKIVRGKYRLQVSLNEKEYELLRWFAYERNETVNVMLKRVALEVAKDYKQNG